MTQGPITDPNQVKILVKQTIDPTDLANACLLADKHVVSISGVTNWNAIDDSTWGLLQDIGAEYAAWYILIGWGTAYAFQTTALWGMYNSDVNLFQQTALPAAKDNPNYAIVAAPDSIHVLDPNVDNYLSDY